METIDYDGDRIRISTLAGEQIMADKLIIASGPWVTKNII
jgi:hypothetical protein